MTKGITIEPGAMPNPGEISIASFLIERGFTDAVFFIKASKIPGMRTPDAEINGLRWEMKTPIGRGTHTIKRAFENGLGQSDNLIFDLRHSKVPDCANVSKLKKEFSDIKKARRLVIITKTKEMLVFNK